MENCALLQTFATGPRSQPDESGGVVPLVLLPAVELQVTVSVRVSREVSVYLSVTTAA